ncbi:MAG: glutamate-semialdehyde--aminomutase, partial [Pseudomonadota bacterium]
GSRFNHLFHGLLAHGVYIAPALYEAGFVSAAHSSADIEHTIAAAAAVFGELAAL